MSMEQLMKIIPIDGERGRKKDAAVLVPLHKVFRGLGVSVIKESMVWKSGTPSLLRIYD